ncbi:MAG: hypothetical protein Q4A62_00275 [Eikenella sp.]|nr:hypothetical protein [Eikenella sp.]
MTRKKANPTPAAEAAAEVKATPDQAAQADIAPDDAEKAAPPPEATPLMPQPSGEPPAEDAEAVLVKTRTAERFFRCGLEFGRAWRLVERKDLSEPNWQRLLAEPHLVAQGVALVAEEPAA